jgi:hypothetical protein
MITYKHFPPDAILEAKNYYFDEAVKHVNADHKRQALDFLIYFDVYRDTCMTENKKRKPNKDGCIEMWLRHNLNRVEAMLERYFKLKELDRL